MHRDKLIEQVKQEYERLAQLQSREHFEDLPDSTTPEAYFEELLHQVIAGIEQGRFDRFMNGRQIVEAVANNRSRWGISA